MKGIILLATITFILSFSNQSAEARLTDANTEVLALNHCPETLPVDSYMRCLERLGQLPRLADSSQTIKEKKIIMRQHEVLAASDCWRLIEIDAFNQCLDEYIGRRRVSDSGEPVDEVVQTANLEESSY